MKKILILATLFIACFQFSNAQIRPSNIKKLPNVDYSQVTFYENTNYGGKGYRLGRGAYSLKALGMAANDFFSSAIIPANLVVMVFENDKYDGTFYILKSDSPSSQPNKDFTNVNVAYGKDTGGRKLSGTKDINDMISSIIIFDPSLDKVTLYEMCETREYTTLGNEAVIYPGPLEKDLDYFNFINGTWGWNSLGKLAIMNDKTSSLYFYPGHNLDVAYIFMDDNFSGQANMLKSNVTCFKNLPYSNPSSGIFSSDWNDRVSSVFVKMQSGKVEIVN